MAWEKAAMVGVGSFVILASFMGPAFAGGQSLAGQTAATGVAGDLSKRAGSNVLGAADKARKVAAQGDERTMLANDVMSDPSADSGSSGVKPSEKAGLETYLSAADLIRAVSDNKDAERELAGRLVRAKGIVLSAEQKDGYTIVVLGPPNGSKTAPVFVFQYPASKAFEAGKLSELEGRFVTRNPAPGGPVVFYVDATAVGMGPDAGAVAPVPAGPVEPFAGWRLVGTVVNAEGGTGVFVRGKDTVYAHAGQVLDGGVKVVGIKQGMVGLRDGSAGEVSTVMAW